MDPLAHIAGLSVIAAIIFGLGAALAALHAFAMRLPFFRWPQPLLPLLAVAAPALIWAGFGLYLLALMAADPTAANLWPLTLGLMAVLWLVWIAVSATVAAVLRRVRRA
ncbi:hypothetical protein N8I71_10050 [Roseibacterium sp. SDUM158016]|uniref:hypothetical protein n=1 Tax=Roseicyclus sediminis TaxID=2980997 RepID=UPI0021CF2546|nr:hypothetical protein [Roseibacterium sp. SDUM158016]MCU4653175.1 hypothetical protein [Roseibacterium sp. SDUM158016]